MKATGIVRRIDDLGRVVIPKEIRRTMRIREGDPLEIFTNHDGEVIFKPAYYMAYFVVLPFLSAIINAVDVKYNIRNVVTYISSLICSVTFFAVAFFVVFYYANDILVEVEPFLVSEVKKKNDNFLSKSSSLMKFYKNRYNQRKIKFHR